jgi:hypothetical protein
MTGIRAVGFTESGGPSVLGVRTVAMPEPGPGEVRVRGTPGGLWVAGAIVAPPWRVPN